MSQDPTTGNDAKTGDGAPPDGLDELAVTHDHQGHQAVRYRLFWHHFQWSDLGSCFCQRFQGLDRLALLPAAVQTTMINHRKIHLHPQATFLPPKAVSPAP